jgi:hypothetical protein
MNNLEKFRFWTRHLFSPDTYVDYGWYYVVSAALQRRAWFGNITGDPLFPNLYVIFVGDAGVGKGLVLGKCNELLRHHTYANENPVDQVVSRKFLFPPGPDDLTYEKLCEKLSKSTQHFKYINGDNSKGVYGHASISFVLEELGSLFKRRHDDSLNRLFLTLYDSKDYEYDTKHQGTSQIRKPCMALLAGCTPNFLPEGIKKGVLEDGTVSRMIFIYEWEPRITKFFLEQPGKDEQNYKEDLLAHIKTLSTMHGEVKRGEGVEKFLEDWYTSIWKDKARKCHPKMRTYYARSRVHVLKLAMAIHFSDSFEMILNLEDCQKALALLDRIEPKMALCFAAAGRNETSRTSKEVLRYISSAELGYSSLPDLLEHFQSEVTYNELTEILEGLKIMGRLQVDNGKYYAKTN